MKVVTTISDVRRAVADARSRGLSIGLVPTMGALHEGHASLIRAAGKETGFVVVSVYVNPTQFGPNEDLDRYPRPFANDKEVCAREGVDLIFHPDNAAIYPAGYCTFVEVKGLGDFLCGASRPGHFRGVATVVLKLFSIVQPDVAYFGQKDAQQLRILQQMTADLNLPVRVQPCPTVHEADGLALSSRNAYLDADQRKHATVLYQALQALKQAAEGGERSASRLLKAMMAKIVLTPGARLDYAAIVDYATLQPIETLRGQVLAALAVYFGKTRLIDNVLLELPK